MAFALVHDCRSLVVVGREVDRDVALIRKDGVGLQVVLLSVVEEPEGLFVWAQDLQEVSRTPRTKKTTDTHHLPEYRVETSRPAKT